jgi:hypothetical protein
VSLHEDLRKQASRLARQDPHRPSQASLRRAVSAVYYALFHLLVDEATRLMLGSSRARRRLRHAIARGFQHREMAEACRSFGGGNLPPGIAGTVDPLPIPPDLGEVARVFRVLQDQRHLADYDLAFRFPRSTVFSLLQQVDGAFEAWRRVRRGDAARFFLIALSCWERMKRS